MSDANSSPMKIKRYTAKTMAESSDSPKIIKRPSDSNIKRRRESNCTCCEGVKKEIQAIRHQQNILQGQMKFLVEAMAEQTVILKQILRERVVEVGLNRKFPLVIEKQLADLNNEITAGNRHSYINALISIIQPEGILENLKNILSTDIVVNYNVDGIHGKHLFKSPCNFYSVLLESIPVNSGSEAQLRKAVNLQKKRHFKKISVEKTNSNNLHIK